MAGAPGAMAGIAINKIANSPMAIEAISNILDGTSNIFRKQLLTKYGREAYETTKINRAANPRKSSKE